MPQIETILIDAAAKAASTKLPAIAADAIRATKTDDPIAQLALELLAQLVEENGAEGIQASADALADLIGEENPSAVFQTDFDAAALTRLASALEDAEAEQKQQVARWVRALGVMLAQLGTVLATAALAAL